MKDKKYKCKECGHICIEDDMGADHWWVGLDDGEVWSNWICPECHSWPESLEEGWILIEDEIDA